MTAKSISVWRAGMFAIGGLLWLGGLPSLAGAGPVGTVDLPAASQMSYQTTVPTPPPTMPQAAVPLPPIDLQSAPVSPGPVSPIPASPVPGAAPSQGASHAPAGCIDNDSELCDIFPCGPREQLWIRADALLWWTNGMKLPSLVTTGPDVSAPYETLLFGNTIVGKDMHGGVRATFGTWIDRCHNWSVESDYFSLSQATSEFSTSSDGNTVLALSGATPLVAFPGQAGTVTVTASSYLQSSGAWIAHTLCSSSDDCDPCEALSDGARDTPMFFGSRTDLLVGFRYYNLSERLGITDNTLTDPLAIGLIRDSFRTRNDFYGSEVGLRTKFYRGQWSTSVLARIAMGSNHRSVDVSGSTTLSGQTTGVGILATPTNSGGFARNSFTVFWLNIEIGYQVTSQLRAYLGYDILYWGSASRAGDQIEAEFTDRTNAFWAQGLNLGGELRF